MNTNLAPCFPAHRGLPLRRGYQGGSTVTNPDEEAERAAERQAQEMAQQQAERNSQAALQSTAGNGQGGVNWQNVTENAGNVAMGAAMLTPVGRAAAPVARKAVAGLSKVVPLATSAGKGAAGLASKVYGGVALPLHAISGAMDGLNTSTEDYAKRLANWGITSDPNGGVLNDTAVRGLGVLSDVANSVTFGWLGRNHFADRQQADGGAAPSAQAAHTGEQPATQAPTAATPAAQQTDAGAAAVQQQMNRTALDPAVEQAWRNQTPRGFTPASTPGVYRSGNSFTNIGADGKPTQASTDASQIRTNGGGDFSQIDPRIAAQLSAARAAAGARGDWAALGMEPRGLPGAGSGAAPAMPRMSEQERRRWQDAAANAIASNQAFIDRWRRRGRPSVGLLNAMRGAEAENARIAQQMLGQDNQMAQEQARNALTAQNAAHARQVEAIRAAAAQQPGGLPQVAPPSADEQMKRLRLGLMQGALDPSATPEQRQARLNQLYMLDGKSDGGGGAGWKVQWNTNPETGRREPQVTPPEHLILAGARQDEQGRWVIPDKDGKLMEIKPE